MLFEKFNAAYITTRGVQNRFCFIFDSVNSIALFNTIVNTFLYFYGNNRGTKKTAFLPPIVQTTVRTTTHMMFILSVTCISAIGFDDATTEHQ